MHRYWDNETREELMESSRLHGRIAEIEKEMAYTIEWGMKSEAEYGNLRMERDELNGKLCDMATDRLRRGIQGRKANAEA